jgi:hypothetical protein
MFFKVDLGTDFEFFADNGGTIVPGEYALKRQEQGIVLDGLAIEVQPKYSTCRELIASDIAWKMHALEGKGIKVSSRYDADFKDVWEDVAEDSKILGCEPDYNGYTGSVNIKNIDGSTITKRYAGGHIHIGGNQGEYGSVCIDAMEDYQNLIPLLDLVVGIPSVLIDRGDNISRRQQYGKAGSFRKKPYGVEYRVLSNFWIKDIKLFYLFFGLARTAINILVNHKAKEDTVFTRLWAAVTKEEVITAINNNDFMAAKNIFERIEGILQECDYKKDGTCLTDPLHDTGLTAFKYLVMNPPQVDDVIHMWTTTNYNVGWYEWVRCNNFNTTQINNDFKKLTLGKNRIGIHKVDCEPEGTKYKIINTLTPSLKGMKAVYVPTNVINVVVDGCDAMYPVVFFDGKNELKDNYVFTSDVKKVIRRKLFKNVIIV